MIIINDPGTILTASQVQTLTAKAAAYPFDLRVFIGTGALTRADFEQQVDQAVAPGSRCVSIGVDMTRRFVHEHASASLGLPSGPLISSAGNPFFKRGDIVEGIDAIAAKANDLRTDTRVIQSQTGAPIVIHEHHTAAGVWWALAGIVVVSLAVVAWAVWRARRRERLAAEAESEREAEAAELRARNIEEEAWHDEMAARRRSARPAVPGATPGGIPFPRYDYQTATSLRPGVASVPASAPTTVVVQQSGGGGSSGVDNLLAYELGRESSRPSERVIEREVEVMHERDTNNSFWSPRSSDDSSSSSSFGGGSDDSSSSSSFDSGGSSDSGGGSDF